MNGTQNFRKAVNGFNRHDVVTYIEYLNNKHRSEIIQLQNQLKSVSRPVEDTGLTTKCAALEAENTALKEELEALRTQLADLQAAPKTEPVVPVPVIAPSCTEQELEAYRRAERVERLAMERARILSQQTKGILADATAQIHISATQLEEAAKTMAAHMDTYKTAVLSAGNILNNAAASLGTVYPEE